MERYDLVKFYSNHFTTDALEKIINIDNLETREFAFKYTTSADSIGRPVCFKSLDKLVNFMGVHGINKAYVGGFYLREFPEDKILQAKVRANEWGGRELSFDIDMDHYINVRKNLCECGTDKVICDKCLVLAKEAVEFAIETLVEDFGLSRKDMVVVFSGRQGFHLWVTSSTKFFKNEQNFPPIIASGMEVDMRTAIAEYLQLITEKKVKKRIDGNLVEEHILSINYKSIPKPLENRLYNFVFKNLVLHSADKTLQEIKGITLKRWRSIREFILSDENNPNIGAEAFGKLINPYQNQSVIQRILNKIVELRYPRYDVGCTKDIHRIMKIPNGIDGSTGNQSVIVEDLETFSLQQVPHISDILGETI